MGLGCIIAALLTGSYWSLLGLSLITIGLYASNAHLLPLPRKPAADQVGFLSRQVFWVAHATQLERGFASGDATDRRSPNQDARSHCRHCIPPFARRFGSKDPQR
jgi:hypothetical protein